MDLLHDSALQLQDSPLLFNCESLLDKSYQHVVFDPAMDPGYFSAGSCLSPTSSVDSFSFSPTSLQAAGAEQTPLDCLLFSSPGGSGQTCEPRSLPACTAPSSSSRRSRSKYPGKKRQTASEREKLRMRDLTKALHHLRTHLPPSVAPPGQTLTKIQTLRLTIRYLEHLSAQLGLTQEHLEQRCSSGWPQSLSQVLPTERSAMSSAHLYHLQPLPQVCSGQVLAERSCFHAALCRASKQNVSVHTGLLQCSQWSVLVPTAAAAAGGGGGGGLGIL